MYFLSAEERQLLLKSLLPSSRKMTIAEELRGWSWSQPPMAPPYSVKLGVYEVANRYCDSGRDVWWRRVQSVRAEPSIPMVEGKLLHSVVANVVARAKRLIWTVGVNHPDQIISSLSDFDSIWFERELVKNKIHPPAETILPKAQMIWEYEAAIIEARIREALSRQPYAREDAIVTTALPVVIEQRLDGTFIGFSSHLSMDAYQSAEPLILELKFGIPQPFHKLQVAGYALVGEALYEFPLNVGCIVYPEFLDNHLTVKKDFFLIDEELRQDLLEQRDERMRIVFDGADPGLASNCPEVCPYYAKCHPVQTS